MIRLIVADDHHLVRQGVCTLLAKHQQIQIVGEAADGEAAVALVEQLAPDIAVLDIAMPRLDGIQATQRICALGNATRVVILSMHDRPQIARRALRAGAKGYVIKHATHEELWLAVDAANQGELYLSPRIAQGLLDTLWLLEENTGVALTDTALSAREKEVLQLITEGHTNQSIANLLRISPKTVEKHRAQLMHKLGATSVADLVIKALNEGLLFSTTV
ncbi:MAG: response regulator transcription factor [Caldilineaceae bacterium]|nr:response regulator transcription factor [Caldilineaceae bacterium]